MENEDRWKLFCDFYVGNSNVFEHHSGVLIFNRGSINVHLCLPLLEHNTAGVFPGLTFVKTEFVNEKGGARHL